MPKPPAEGEHTTRLTGALLPATGAMPKDVADPTVPGQDHNRLSRSLPRQRLPKQAADLHTGSGAAKKTSRNVFLDAPDHNHPR